MTVQCPPAFRLSYMAIAYAASSCAIFLLFSPLCCPFSFFLSFFLSFCTSVFRHLAVCNTDESVLCWCVLTTCISGSSFLSTYSTNFVISPAWAASNCIKPLPPCFLGTYKRSTSAFGWWCPWIVNSFLVFRSSFCSSSWCQLIIPKLYLSTGTANDPIAWIIIIIITIIIIIIIIITTTIITILLFQGLISLACCVIVYLSLFRVFLYVHALPIGNVIESLEVCFFFQTVYLVFFKNINAIFPSSPRWKKSKSKSKLSLCAPWWHVG